MINLCKLKPYGDGQDAADGYGNGYGDGAGHADGYGYGDGDGNGYGDDA